MRSPGFLMQQTSSRKMIWLFEFLSLFEGTCEVTCVTIAGVILSLALACSGPLRPQARPKLQILLANVAAHALAHVLRMIPGDCRVKLEIPELSGGGNVHFLFIWIPHSCAEVLEGSDAILCSSRSQASAISPG
jgi:hypothetical protein